MARILSSIQPTGNKLEFPKLTQKQIEFAVSPGYQSYNDPKIRTLAPYEHKFSGHDEFEASENSEVVDDPFKSEGKAKKAIGLTRDEMAIMEAALEQQRLNDIYFTTTVAVSSALLAFIIVGAGICYHRHQNKSKAVEDIEYPAYGVAGIVKDTSPSSADRKLAQNAQLYHYQHQKQQMMGIESHTNGHRSLSDNESDDEEGEFTVYECPGLAPAGEMEVRNPMFEDDGTPRVDNTKK